jgi:hypothetical protein
MPPALPEPASPPSGRRLWLAITVSLALLVVAVIAGSMVGRRLAPESNGSNPSAPAAARFVAGQRLLYKMDFDCAVASNFGAIFSDTPSVLMNQLFDANIQSEMRVTVLEADAQHTSLAYEFRHPGVQFQSDGQDDPNQSQAIQAALGQTVFCLLNGRGSVQSVWFSSNTNSVAQQLVCTLLAAMQIVEPKSHAESATTWEAEEDDPSGRYIAHYEVQADGTIHKTKLRYLPPTPIKKSRTIQLTPTIQSDGEDVAALDSDGSLESLAAAESQAMSLQNKDIGHGLLKLDLHLLSKQEATPNDMADLRTAEAQRFQTTHAVSLYAPPSQEESNRVIQREALGTATLESVLAELKQAEKESPPEKQITQLYLKLKALAFIRPESCAQLGELLAGAKTGSLRMQILADALESAGNSQAQAALGGAILGRTDDLQALRLLIPALGSVESPTPQTEDTLLALAFGKYDKNVRTTARLALGNAARSLGDESRDRSAKIVDRILQELKDPPATETWELLLALGNAGSIEALPTLKRYLDDPAPNLRGAAAWALRWIDSPEVDDLLTKMLAEDKDSAVRLETVRAIRFREKTPQNIGAQKKAFANESEPEVRIELLGNLWDCREADPEVKQLVEKAATDDPSEAVRKAADKILESP